MANVLTYALNTSGRMHKKLRTLIWLQEKKLGGRLKGVERSGPTAHPPFRIFRFLNQVNALPSQNTLI